MQYIKIQETLSSDFTYNDVYYRVQHQTSNRKHKEKIILINTANLSSDYAFRAELSEVIKKVEEFKPKAVGVDITYSNRTDSSTLELLKVLQSNKNIVCAYKKSALKGEYLVR